MYITLRHTEKMACLISRNADFQGTAVRHPDILTRKTNQTPCHVQRVLPRLQHSRKPVNSCIHVRVAHGFMQGTDQIVVLLSLSVIQQRLLGGTLLQHLFCDDGSRF